MAPLVVSVQLKISPMGPNATLMAARSTLQIMAIAADSATTVFQSSAVLPWGSVAGTAMLEATGESTSGSTGWTTWACCISSGSMTRTRLTSGCESGLRSAHPSGARG